MDYPHIIQGRIRVPYRNYAGKVGSKFLVELRDNRRIMGLRCSTCGITYVPPKSVCPRCLSELNDWVEVSNSGTVSTYAVVNYSYSPRYQPRDIPYAIGIVKLDGADTGLCHFLEETNLSKLKVGMRVEAVFQETREGSILDIKHFGAL